LPHQQVRRGHERVVPGVLPALPTRVEEGAERLENHGHLPHLHPLKVPRRGTRPIIYLGRERGSATPVVERAAGTRAGSPQRGVTQVAKRDPPPAGLERFLSTPRG